MENICVLGAGAMGTALSFHLSKIGHKVNLWGTFLDEEIIKTRRQKKVDLLIPEEIRVFPFEKIEDALRGVKFVIFCISSEGVNYISEHVAPYIKDKMVVVNVGKGIADAPFLTLCELIESNLKKYGGVRKEVVAMGGPARAPEIVKEVFTGVVFSSIKGEDGKICCEVFQGKNFKTNFTEDKRGVELCAAIKNGYAISIGIAEGLQESCNNFKAALISHAVGEMMKIVKLQGGRLETVTGLAGVGDLYVTSQAGRNRTFGKLLGEGMSVEEALDKMRGETVEGYSVVDRIKKRILDKLLQEKKIKKEDFLLLYALHKILYEEEPARIIRDALSDF